MKWLPDVVDYAMAVEFARRINEVDANKKWPCRMEVKGDAGHFLIRWNIANQIILSVRFWGDLYPAGYGLSTGDARSSICTDEWSMVDTETWSMPPFFLTNEIPKGYMMGGITSRGMWERQNLRYGAARVWSAFINGVCAARKKREEFMKKAMR